MTVVGELIGIQKEHLEPRIDYLQQSLEIKHLKNVQAKNLSGGS